MNETRVPGFPTLCIHAGQEPEPVTGAVSVPIFQTSTYAQKSPGKHTGYEYSRMQNPTRDALQAALAHAMGKHCEELGGWWKPAVRYVLPAGSHTYTIRKLPAGTTDEELD